MDIRTMTVGAVRERLIEMAAEDETFRARLLADPTKTVEDELGIKAPEGFTLEVHEEAANVSHLVLPPPSQLEEAALAQAAGGHTVMGMGRNSGEWYHGAW